ncbi:hypothetical protein CsSME_00000627 [Camellia sinensis var. sinensis]
MNAKESYKDPSMAEQYQEEEDQTEETLSLCDLPMYSDAKEEDQSLSSSSFSSDQDDFFEFFSEDWSTLSSYPVQNIVFCGKLIASKEPSSETEHTHKIETNKQDKPRKSRLFRWNSKMFRSSKSTNPKIKRCVSSPKSLSLPVGEEFRYKGGEKYGFPVRRVSVVAAPVKPRRSLLMFGLARMPPEMELRDIRSRQGRRSRSTVVRRSGGAGSEKVRRGKGLLGIWWLIRALGCGGYHHYATTMPTRP